MLVKIKSISPSHDPNDDPHCQLQGGNDKKDTRWQEERGKRDQESRYVSKF